MSLFRNRSLGNKQKGNTSEKASNLKSKGNIVIGEVMNDIDPEGGNRVQVRIDGVDKEGDDLPWAIPFLPLHINVVPKKYEWVKIILFGRGDDALREYVGPIIPQIQNVKESIGDIEALRGRPSSGIEFDKSIEVIKTTKNDKYPNHKLYPEKEEVSNEISIIGRDNSDIIFKKSEVILRALKHKKDEPTVINTDNPAYIQIKGLDLADNKSTRGDIKMVSNKIYLIGRNSGNGSIIEPFQTDEEQLNSLEGKLHPIVYGDILKDFIDKLWSWVQSHTHPYHNMPTNPNENPYIQLEKWMLNDFNKLNSTNIFAGGDIETNVKNGGKVNDVTDKNTQGRDNSSITRVGDQDKPILKINGDYIVDTINNFSWVRMIIINIVDDTEVYSFDRTESTLQVAYDVVSSNIVTYITQNELTSDIKIPEITDLKTAK